MTRLISGGFSYLVKDKLSVPDICDADQTDNLPGEALGCRAYSNTAGTPVYLHNFSYLCRDEAVGCTKVYDTNNRDITDANAGKYLLYNLWKSKTPGAQGATLKIETEGTSSSCFAAKEEGGCFTSPIFML